MKVKQELFCDVVESIKTNDGILWVYVKNNKIIDEAFMTYRELYEILATKNQN